MGKFDFRRLTTPQRRHLQDELTDAIRARRGREELLSFLRDLLTPSEIVMVARRLQVATLLRQGLSYEAIRQKLGVGLHTIAHVDQCLARKVEV